MCWATKVDNALRATDGNLLNISKAMKRMAVSNVLVVGMKGLGVEIGAFSFYLELEQGLKPMQPRMSSSPV